jgi:hypothetical protein
VIAAAQIHTWRKYGEKIREGLRPPLARHM